MKNALAYIRLIPDRQGHKKQVLDYKGQVEDIEQYCKANDYTITERYEEKFAGSNIDRDFAKTLVQYFENHKDTKYLIIQDPSKLGKSSEVSLIIETLNNIGICTVITNANLVSLNEDGSINNMAMQSVLNISRSDA